jgi:heat shock protein HtpX
MEQVNFMGNQFRTALLLGVMTILVIGMGQLLGGRQGMLIAFVLAAGMNFFSYWYSDKIVLRMYRAQEVTAQQAPDLYQMVATLAQRASMPMPRVYIIPKQTPNAFATGRNPENAVVAVTQGLIANMNKQEIMGVLAHEMAHVKGRDILIGSIAATMAGAIMLLASMARWSAILGRGNNGRGGGLGGIGLIVMSLVAPMAAMIVQMAVSRSREYQADAEGAQLAGSSEGLASALEKLDSLSRRVPMEANPTTAHMFIVNPLSGRNMMSLFSTHPPTEERVARLRGIRTQQPPPSSGTPRRDHDQRMQQGRSFWDSLS